MDERDLIRELMNLFDRFTAEWITICSEYERATGKSLDELEKETNKHNESYFSFKRGKIK